VAGPDGGRSAAFDPNGFGPAELPRWRDGLAPPDQAPRTAAWTGKSEADPRRPPVRPTCGRQHGLACTSRDVAWGCSTQHRRVWRGRPELHGGWTTTGRKQGGRRLRKKARPPDRGGRRRSPPTPPRRGPTTMAAVPADGWGPTGTRRRTASLFPFLQASRPASPSRGTTTARRRPRSCGPASGPMRRA